MRFPLSFYDFSIWVTIVAIIILFTSEILQPKYKPKGIHIDTVRLRKVALMVSLLFLVTTSIIIVDIILWMV